MVNSEGIRPENYSKGRVSPELIKYMLRNSKCPWCGLFCFRDYNREHIVPRSLGGSNRFNIMRAHPTCNKNRGSDFKIPLVSDGWEDFYKYFTNDMLLYTIRSIYYNKYCLRMYYDKPEEIDRLIDIIHQANAIPQMWSFDEN